jgi:predicted DNA-binding transcriptional regulator AlpA
MNEYAFQLRARLSRPWPTLDLIEERLGDAGCTDALLGLGAPGRIALDFERTAPTATAAIESAHLEVLSAFPDAEIAEVVPDLVGLSDVAPLVGVSRQNLRKLMLSHPETFPMPVHQGSTAIWHLEEVLAWLVAFQRYELDPRLVEVASAARKANLARRALAPR